MISRWLDRLTFMRIDAMRWVHANTVLSIVIAAAVLGVLFIAVAR